LDTQQRQAEIEQIGDSLAHQAFLEEAKTVAEIQRKQKQQQLWREAEHVVESIVEPSDE
jgi:hypothetical protein